MKDNSENALFPFSRGFSFFGFDEFQIFLRTYQDPGLSPFKLPSNKVMATEHRGFQKPQDCCGHKLERSLSRAHREGSTDKFFPPGSPHPDALRTAEAGDLGIHGNLRPQHGAAVSKTMRGRNAGAWQRVEGCSTMSPPRPNKGGAAFVLHCP